jgi:16S rRNA (cytosine1402-N4)-methyltransferase
MTGGTYHQPVMVKEVLEGLAIIPGGNYVDATYGGGGHAQAILSLLGNGKLLVFDQDEDAFLRIPEDPRLIAVHENFRHLNRFLKLYGIGQVDGILADLGVSSHQIDTAGRGFSIRLDAPLDMRMDRRQGLDAATILASYTEAQLQKLFSQYGEVTNARTLAKVIVNSRGASAIRTTGELISAIKNEVKGNPNRYLAQVFQALRIAVNDELESLKDFLTQAADSLRTSGRLVIISFHSLEDRLVKRAFKPVADPGSHPFSTGPGVKGPFRQLHKKPLAASAEEIAFNPRAASARMRIAEKIS